MAPIRTKHSTSVSHKAKGKRSQTREQQVPGVQKIKAALRQTRRLLAKENLAADVRVETERRLKSLEADLAQAETSRKERTLAVRYHKIKFFERQKVIRKIEQLKKQASSNDLGLEQELFDQRVNLNYILHYPKTSKYISLFPPEVRNGESTQAAGSEKTSHERDKLKLQIRKAMEKEELALQPELELRARELGTKKTITSASLKPSKKTKKPQRNEPTPEKDDFFEEDEDEEEEDEDTD